MQTRTLRKGEGIKEPHGFATLDGPENPLEDSVHRGRSIPGAARVQFAALEFQPPCQFNKVNRESFALSNGDLNRLCRALDLRYRECRLQDLPQVVPRKVLSAKVNLHP